MAQTTLTIGDQTYRIKPQTILALRELGPLQKRVVELTAQIETVDAELISVMRERYFAAEAGEATAAKLEDWQTRELELRARLDELELERLEARLARLAVRVEAEGDAPAIAELDVRDLEAAEGILAGREERPTATPI
jgi:hypothetical protein